MTFSSQRHLLGVALHAGNFLNGGTPFLGTSFDRVAGRWSGREWWWDFLLDFVLVGMLFSWNLKHPLKKWLFQLDDSKSLHEKWLFHQTSIKKWLFGVPGLCFFFWREQKYNSKKKKGGLRLRADVKDLAHHPYGPYL